MLERWTAGDVVYYRSPLLQARGVPHAFSTRLGGISPAPFDSMNLGNPNGSPIQDDYANVWENYRILQAACGLEGRELCRVHQVHGCGVVAACEGQAFDCGVKGDALVTRDPARVLSVRIADCVPVLVASPDGRTVAAVHAGWRGVIEGVLPAAIDSVCLLDCACEHEQVIIAIGPCISMESFEVGPEVLSRFEWCFGRAAPIRRRADGKGHVDLREAIRLQAIGLGIPDDRIDTSDRCTFTDRAEFFSHRRDNGSAGRMAALISPLCPQPTSMTPGAGSAKIAHARGNSGQRPRPCRSG